MPRFNSQRRAFSLVELLTAMAVSGVLVGAMSVTLVTAASAMERGEGAIDGDRIAADALADLQSDLSEATRFFERKPAAVWFEVPDRNDDGVAEHIRYAWSGVAGDPLTRSTNGGTAAVVAANVRQLNLSYILRAGVTQTVSAERLISDFTSHAGASTATTVVSGTSWAAQVIRPSFAANVASWKATKLRLRLKQSGAVDATSRVSIVSVNSDFAPGSTVYATAEVKESLLSATSRLDEIVFASCQAIPSGASIAIVVQDISGAAASCEVSHLTSLTPTMPFNIWRSTSTNSGGTWQGYGQTQNTVFELYGTVTTEAK